MQYDQPERGFVLDFIVIVGIAAFWVALRALPFVVAGALVWWWMA